MSLFGRRESGQRSAAEREAARLERERRRAEREGRPLPEGPPPDDDTGSSAVDDDEPPFAWEPPGAHPGAPEPRIRRGPARHEPEPDVEPDAEGEPEAEAGAGRVGEAEHEPGRGPEPAPGGSGASARDAEPGPGGDRPRDAEPGPGGDRPRDAEPAQRAGRDHVRDAEPARGAERDHVRDAEPARGAERDHVPDAEPARGAGRDPVREPVGDAEPAPTAPPAWNEPRAEGQAHPRARAWQQRPGPATDQPPAPWRARDRDRDGERAHDAERDRDGLGAAGAAAARGAGDPQATQPFEPVAETAPPRRTVSLPRPQTDSGEWDAPIGTRRVSRGTGRYQPQPGAPGYPPYRQLVTKPRRRWLRRIVVLFALALAIAAAAFAFLLFQPLHGDGHGRVELRVPSGATARQIGDLLADRGVVRSGFLFSLRARLSGQRAKLRSGRYVLKQGMPYSAALTALTTPPKAAPVINVTVPEGPSRRETAAQIRGAGVQGSYLAASRRSSKLDPRDYGAPRSVRTLEGFLYPATYELRRSQATARRLVNRQLDAFKDAFAKVDMRQARRKNLSRYDVLIIASMIEREALVPRDRRLISAVIYNRLKDGIPIGIDATLRYALNQWSRPLRVSELESDSAFNTRRHRGLPPTPIGNPGLQAMRAAANPANVSYLFYVVKPCGRGAHAFSSTDAQFQRDVQRYNRARARRGGKDPSRC